MKYFITNKREFDVKKSKLPNILEVYKSLEFKNIDKIIIIPIRRKENSIAHIDFFSKFILDNFEKVYFNIDYETHEINACQGWRNSQNSEKHRFYYVKNYKEVENLLHQIVPDEVQIEKH